MLDVILVAALITAGYSGYKLYAGLHDYHETDQVYEKIREESRPAVESSAQEETGRDWDALKAINADIAGWIYLADSTVDYPVVYASDNSFYLYHLYDGTTNRCGSIFVDYRNARNFTDKNTVIYGHHMDNDSMFNNIANYQDPSWYETHQVISLETPEADYELQPVAGVVRSGTDAYVQIEFASDEDYLAYVQSFIDDSTFSSGVSVTAGDQTVLLSTCTDAVGNGRYALLCRLVKK